jgi:hypothetical protein
MTFLNPLALFGLAAAAIPILIHLLNIRKLRVVEFSSLRFLKELQKTRMRRLKLRQWLVLLFRTLLIVFLILAFSRPAIKGSLASIGGGRAASSLVILLDDSPTMGMRNDHGELFQQGKDALAQLMTTTTSADEIHLEILSDSIGRDTPSLPISPSSLAKGVGGMSVSRVSRPYLPYVARGLKTLAASRNANKELFLISDAQGTEFAVSDTAALPGPAGGSDVHVYLLEIPPSRRDNGAARSLTIDSRLLSPQRPIQFRGTVRNFGDTPIENTVASLYLDGARVAQQTMSIAPHASATVLMSGVAKRRGFLGASLHIDDDAFSLDNDRYCGVHIPQHVSILCAGANQTDTRFPASAFAAAVDSTQSGFFSILQTTHDRLQIGDIRGADVIVLSNIATLSPAEAAAITDAVKSGRGLLIFPGKNTNYRNLNSSLLAPLGIPAVTPADLSRLQTNRAGFLSFSKVEYTHPVFEGMFTSEPGKQGSSPAIQSPQIQTAAGLQTGTSGYSIITMSNGSPFLCEYAAGKGRVLILAVESGTTWSDFPFKGLFAPLLHRTILYLASQHDIIETATVGDRLRFPLRMTSDVSGKAFVAQTPSGDGERLQPEQHTSSGMTVFQTKPTKETGVYFLLPADSASMHAAPRQAIAVNSSPEESDLSRITDDAFKAFWARLGIAGGNIHDVKLPADIHQVITESRYGVELWRLFVLLAIACALTEMALSRAGKTAHTPEDHASHDQ